MRIIRRIGRCLLLMTVLLLCLGWMRSYFYYEAFNLHLERGRQDAGLKVRSSCGFLQAYFVREFDEDEMDRPVTAGMWLGVCRGVKEVEHAWESGRYTAQVTSGTGSEMGFDHFRYSVCGRGSHIVQATVPYWIPTGGMGLPLVCLLVWRVWSFYHPQRGFEVLDASLKSMGATRGVFTPG